MAKATTNKAPKPAAPAEDAKELQARKKEEAARQTVLDGTIITDRQIQIWFQHNQPDAEAVQRIELLRKAAAAYAQIVKNQTRNCPDQQAAIRHIREASMTAISAVVCRGR